MMDQTILNVIEDYRSEIRLLKEQVQYFASKEMCKPKDCEVVRFSCGTSIEKTKSADDGQELVKVSILDDVALITLYDFAKITERYKG